MKKRVLQKVRGVTPTALQVPKKLLQALSEFLNGIRVLLIVTTGEYERLSEMSKRGLTHRPVTSTRPSTISPKGKDRGDFNGGRDIENCGGHTSGELRGKMTPEGTQQSRGRKAIVKSWLIERTNH